MKNDRTHYKPIIVSSPVKKEFLKYKWKAQAEIGYILTNDLFILQLLNLAKDNPEWDEKIQQNISN